ncbi:MAG: sigma-70 family RNA polymerase sigma factor [Crocinitomicaceae bacterium]
MKFDRPNTEIDDRDQIAKAKKNREAFGPLYEKYFERVFLFIFKRLGDEDTTGDICQLVFLKAMMNIDKYEDRGAPFGAWLFRIASNELNMYFRKSKKTHIVEIEESGLVNMMKEMEVSEDKSVEIELQEKLIVVMNALSPDQAELIDLRFFQSMSFKEIADIYDISEASAKMKTYRLLEKIKKDWF